MVRTDKYRVLLNDFKVYPGANFALLSALSGLTAECSYAAPNCLESQSVTGNLTVLQFVYKKLLRFVAQPFPPVMFFHGMLVAPARFASTFRYRSQVFAYT